MDYDAVLHQMKKDNIKGKYKYRLTAKEIVQCGEEAFCQCKKIKIVYLTPTIKKEEEEQIKYITLVDEEDSASLNKKFKDCLDSFTAEILKELYI